MNLIPELPKSLYSLRDAIINSILKSTPLPEIQPIYDWLEGDGWDALVGSWSNQEMAVKLGYLSQHQFDDSEVATQEEIEDEDVTDEMPLAYARQLIDDSIDDGYICPSIHTYKLEQGNDTSPVIGCLMEIHGQAGPAADWWGIFKNPDEFYEELNECDIVLLSKSELISDERLISLWKK
jgi:hypothetical protein